MSEDARRDALEEKFMQDMGRSCTDEELLRLLLPKGFPFAGYDEEAKSLIEHYKNLGKLLVSSAYDLKSNGVSSAHVAYLRATYEGCRRIVWQHLLKQNNPISLIFNDLLDYCQSTMAHQSVEELHVIFLDKDLKIIEGKLMQRGSIDIVSVYTREIVREVIELKAFSILMIHNHPSGSSAPSLADRRSTKEIAETLKGLGLDLYDHVIISTDGHYSFREHGLIG